MTGTTTTTDKTVATEASSSSLGTTQERPVATTPSAALDKETPATGSTLANPNGTGSPSTTSPTGIDMDASDSQPKTVTGICIYPGIAFGKAQTFSEGDLDIPHFVIDKSQVRSESLRLRAAFTSVTKELQELLDNPVEGTPVEANAFLEMHLQIVCDESLITSTQDIVGEKLVNAEWALALKLDELRKAFQEIDDDYLAERIEDIADVFDRIQHTLIGRRRLSADVELSVGKENIILFAHQLSPADIIVLKRHYDDAFAAIVVETGSATSHAAILARSLEIPMVVGAIGVTELVKNDDSVLLDATAALITIHPDAQALEDLVPRLKKDKETRQRLKKLRQTASVTSDGVSVHLYANISLPEDVTDAVRAGAEGVGLFRSEFLFMNRTTLPSENEQLDAYRRVVRSMKGKPVILRTMDLGGDKLLDETAQSAFHLDAAEELALSLGKRGLRFSRAHPELFDVQVRAILRAAADGDVRMLLPMITHPSELDFARERIGLAEAELEKRGVKFKKGIALGAMIEVPSAAIWIQAFLPKLDFLSIGTNDLVQYTLASNRHDPSVNYLYSPRHPAVLYLIHRVTKLATAAKVPVGICGEIAGDPTMLKLLLGFGLRNFSMESGRILALKEKVLASNCGDCAKAVLRLSRVRSPEKAEAIIRELS